MKQLGEVQDARHGMSLPARGAWIETNHTATSIPLNPGRSPRGERGLKQKGSDGGAVRLAVAPRAGSVD